MSNLKIRKALETAVKAFDPAFPTAWENVKSDLPDSDIPYQAVNILFAEPENPSVGRGHYRQRGILQISLRYPVNVGTGDAVIRAEQLRLAFARGLSFSADGVTVNVDRTPEVPTGIIDGDRFVINVRVRFYSDIFGGA